MEGHHHHHQINYPSYRNIPYIFNTLHLPCIFKFDKHSLFFLWNFSVPFVFRWTQAHAPGGPSSIVNPLALMSLPHRKTPAPPPPITTGRHVPNIAEIGASFVAEATQMMKQRLAEHTLSNLRARMEEEFYKNSFRQWHKSSANARNFYVSAQRALDRHGLRVQRRGLHSWQDSCMWSRILENLAKVAITRKETQHKSMALDVLIEHQHRMKRLHLIMNRADSRCLRTISRRWVMSSRINRVRRIQVVRLLERKVHRLVQVSFAALVAVRQAERGLYSINRLVQKTAILSGAVTLRAWREHIECNSYLEKAGCVMARRWELIGKRRIFMEWFRVWTFHRTAVHAGFAIAEKTGRHAQRSTFVAWGLAKHKDKLLRCAALRITNKGSYRLAAKAWAQWVEVRATCRRNEMCFRTILALGVKISICRAFDGWKIELEQSRRLKTVERKSRWHDWQLLGSVLTNWRQGARRSSKFGLWHDTTERRLKRIWLLNCFSHWSQRSLDYWRSWRKCENIKARFGSTAISLHFSTWKQKMRSKESAVLFSAKINTRVLGNVVQEWFSLSQKEIAKTGHTEQGINRMADTRAFRMKTECIDMWAAKFCSRKRIDEISDVNEQKRNRALTDKYLAEWMRRQDDFTFRNAQILKHTRMLRNRMMVKTMSCFARNREETRTDAHRTRHITLRLCVNLCSETFKQWVDIWAVRKVKGKIYYGLLARGDFKTTSWCFGKWLLWQHIRKEQEQKIAKSLWLNVPRFQARWVLNSWSDKHMRTMHFERLVLNKIRLCCQGAFDSWYNNAKDRALQASCISKLRQRVDTKSVCYCLETWHDHSMFERFSDLVVSRAKTLKNKIQRQRVLAKWGSTAAASGKLRSRMSIFAMRVKSTASACIFSGWNEFRVDWCRRVQDLSHVIRRGHVASKKLDFQAWKAVYSTEKLRNIRLKNVCKRLFQGEIRASLTKWNELSYDTGLLMRKYLHLEHASSHRVMHNAFKGFDINCKSWQTATKIVSSCWQKSLLDAAAHLFLQWRNQFYFDRKAKKVLSLAFARNDEAVECKAFAIWLCQQRKTKKLDRQVDAWDQRDATRFFDAWLAMVLQHKDNRIRAWLMCLRSDRKLCNQVFLFWANLSATLRTRRIKLIKRRGRVDSRQLRSVFVGLFEVVAMVRRRRQLLQKTRVAVDKCSILNAAQKLLANSKARLCRRRIFRMLLNRHQTKIVRHAWGEWEMRLEVSFFFIVFPWYNRSGARWRGAKLSHLSTGGIGANKQNGGVYKPLATTKKMGEFISPDAAAREISCGLYELFSPMFSPTFLYLNVAGKIGGENITSSRPQFLWEPRNEYRCRG